MANGNQNANRKQPPTTAPRVDWNSRGSWGRREWKWAKGQGAEERPLAEARSGRAQLKEPQKFGLRFAFDSLSHELCEWQQQQQSTQTTTTTITTTTGAVRGVAAATRRFEQRLLWCLFGKPRGFHNWGRSSALPPTPTAFPTPSVFLILCCCRSACECAGVYVTMY